MSSSRGQVALAIFLLIVTLLVSTVRPAYFAMLNEARSEETKVSIEDLSLDIDKFFKEVALKNGDYRGSVKEQPGSASVVQGVEKELGGIGYSVGGELLIEAAAENDGVAAVVSEGAGERCLDDVHRIAHRGDEDLGLIVVIVVDQADVRDQAHAVDTGVPAWPTGLQVVTLARRARAVRACPGRRDQPRRADTFDDRGPARRARGRAA